MAGDGGNRSRRVVGGVAEKIQTELGLLVISLEECALDCLGLARRGLRLNLPAVVPRLS